MPTTTANAPANNVIQHPSTPRPMRDESPNLAISVDEAAERLRELKRFVREQMVQGVDYGLIQGTPKPTLFKPGAEKLLAVFGFATKFETLHRVENFNDAKPLVSYEVRVSIINKRSQLLEAEGVGSCNSRERRYARQDAANVANTVLRMAKKRALVDATLLATRTGGMFQSEDFDDDSEPTPPARTAQRPAQPRPAQQPAAPRQPVLIANREQLDACEAMRLRAIKLGYRTDAGTEPKPIADGATKREASAKYHRWKAFVDAQTPQQDGANTQQNEEIAQQAPPSRGRKYMIPKHSQPRHCTSCGEPIWFVRSDEGASLPIDKTGYSHFTSCPNASQHSKTSKPGLPKHIKHLWKVATEKGLDTGPETRTQRLANANKVLLDHQFDAVDSFNKLNEPQARCLAVAIDTGILTWGQPVPAGEAA